MADVHVVEDDPAYLYVVQQALKNTGHTITYHTSSYSAWDAVAAGVPMTCCSPTCGFNVANQMV